MRVFSDAVDIFEYHLNEKVVWSYKLLKEYPNFDELKEVTYWMDQVDIVVII